MPRCAAPKFRRTPRPQRFSEEDRTTSVSVVESRLLVVALVIAVDRTRRDAWNRSWATSLLNDSARIRVVASAGEFAWARTTSHLPERTSPRDTLTNVVQSDGRA